METRLECRLEFEEMNKIKGLAKLFAKTDEAIPLLDIVQRHIDLAFKQGYNIGRDHSIHYVTTFTLK